MEGVRRIARNIFVLTAAEFIVRVLQIFLVVFMARELGSALFGRYNFAISFSMIAVILAGLGLQLLLVLKVSRDRKLAARYLSNSLYLKLWLTIGSFLLVMLFLNLLGYLREVRIIVYIFFGSFLLKSFTDLFSSVFVAYEEMQWDGAIKALRAILLTAGVVAALWNGYGLFAVALLYLCSEAALLILSFWIMAAKYVRIKYEHDWAFIKGLFMESIPFALTLVFYNIYFYIGSVMLSKMRGDYEVGIYSAAYNIPLAIMIIPYIYTFAIFPVLSRVFTRSSDSFKMIYGRSAKYMMVLAPPIAVGFFVLAPQIITILYGHAYESSIIVLRVLSIVVIFRFLSNVNGSVLASMDRQKERVVYQGITAAVNIVLNLLIIPIYGFVGAAITTVISELLLMLLYYHLIMKYVDSTVAFFEIWKPFVAALAASCIFLASISLWVQIAFAACIYVGLTLLMRVFDNKDLEMLQAAVKKRV